MHYCILVVLEKAGKTMEEIGRQVDEVMAPYHGKEYDLIADMVRRRP